jgi:hypothetical protein
MDFLKAWVRDSVLLISREKISEPASMVKGVSSPRDLAIPILKAYICYQKWRLNTYAMAVFPVPGCPPIRMALPAIFCSLIICRIIPAALLALTYRTNEFEYLSLKIRRFAQPHCAWA